MSLFDTLASEKTAQGYSNWKTCVIEHFVRAVEILVNESRGNTSESLKLLNDYAENRKFIFLSFIVEKLREYRIKRGFTYDKSVTKTLADLEKKYFKE